MRAGRLGRIGVVLLAAAGFALGCSSSEGGSGAGDEGTAAPDAGAVNEGGGGADAAGSATTDTGPGGGAQPADAGAFGGPQESDVGGSGPTAQSDGGTGASVDGGGEVPDSAGPPDATADVGADDTVNPTTGLDAPEPTGDAEPGTAATSIPAGQLKSFAMQWSCPNGSAPQGLGAWVDFEPFSLRFDDVPAGETRTLALLLHNRGDAPLVVDSATVEGDAVFSFEGAGACGPDACGAGGFLPVTVEPGGFTVLRVSFAPTDAAAHEGTLRISTNDPRWPAGLPVALYGNAQAPCIDILPHSIEFGGVVPGTSAQVPVEITVCGGSNATISSLALDGAGASAFSLQVGGLPVDLAPGEHLDAVLTYSPPAAAALDSSGLPVADSASLVVQVDGLTADVSVPVRGTGLADSCPAVQVSVSDSIVEWNAGVEAQPALAGGQPLPPDQSWKWRISPPTPAAPPASIDEATGTVEIPLTVAGAWSFAYALGDASCQPECVPSVATAIVRPAGNVAVELSWVTPADPDESDEGPYKGSDLDLHFVFADPVATGPDLDGDGKPDGWFDQHFDCFWFNPEANWGSLDPNIDDNPSLVRDDTDGAGPETLRFSAPQDGATYRIGVHYWNDHSFGSAHAIVRMFRAGVLERVTTRTLEESDMWCAGTLNDWPQGGFDECQGPLVVPNYINPFFNPNGG